MVDKIGNVGDKESNKLDILEFSEDLSRFRVWDITNNRMVFNKQVLGNSIEMLYLTTIGNEPIYECDIVEGYVKDNGKQKLVVGEIRALQGMVYVRVGKEMYFGIKIVRKKGQKI